MTDYKKLNNVEKSRRYFNVKARCGTAYQNDNPRYYGTYLCLIVPHSINTFFESIEVGKTNITKRLMTKKYGVKVYDNGEWIRANNIDTYNHALDKYCEIKQGILVSKAKALKNVIPEKVYRALLNTDVKAINSKNYLADESEV